MSQVLVPQWTLYAAAGLLIGYTFYNNSRGASMWLYNALQRMFKEIIDHRKTQAELARQIGKVINILDEANKNNRKHIELTATLSDQGEKTAETIARLAQQQLDYSLIIQNLIEANKNLTLAVKSLKDGGI